MVVSSRYRHQRYYRYLQEKLDKACVDLMRNDVFFENFFERMDRWLLSTAQTAVDMFLRYDEDNSGQITYDEFKSGEFLLVWGEGARDQLGIGTRNRKSLSSFSRL